MTFVKRALALAVVALAVVPFAAATPSKTSQSCKSNEFYYSKKDCCLSSGGPKTHPTPPSGKSCPVPSDKNVSWYWHEGKSCCVPTNPLPPNNPGKPSCKSGHGWQDATQCCVPTTPSQPSHTPHPSAQPGHGSGSYGGGHGGGHGWKRNHLSRSAPTCPKGLDACPISGSTSGDYECLDTSAELESCGGCASAGQGQDCTAIPGVWNVGCESGSCKVYSCSAGHKLSNGTCVPL